MPDRDALQGLRGATRGGVGWGAGGGPMRLFGAPAAAEAGSTATRNDTHHVTHMTFFLILFFILHDIYLQLVLVEQLLMGAPHGERARLFLIYY